MHGTWPKGVLKRFLPPLLCSRSRTWFDDGSRFRQDLHERLNGRIRFEVFNWSGDNSMRARAKAAVSLRDRIVALRAAEPETRLLIIAHSHGGNVALRAVSLLESRERLLGVATLATPFLQLRERPTGRAERVVLNVLGVAMILAIMAVIYVACGGYNIHEGLFNYNPDSLTGLFLTFISVGAAVFALGGAIKLWNRLVSKLAVFLRQILADGSLPELRGLPLLVLRCRGDEASVALALVGAFATINHFLWKSFGIVTLRIFTWLVLPTAGWVLLTGLPIAFGAGDYLGFSPDTQVAIILGPVALLFAPLVFVPPLVLLFSASSGALLLPFGSELFGLGYFLYVEARVTGPADPTRIVVLGSTQFFHARPVGPLRRRHSVYALPATRERLAKWMTDLLRD